MKLLTVKSRRPLVLSAGLMAALVLIAWRLPGGLELTVTPVEGGPPLLAAPMQPGERFTIQYYHAGMGRMPGVGRMVKRGEYEVIEDMHMPTGNFVLRVGSPGVDHTVIWRGCKTNLSSVAPHVAVRFAARPVSLLYALWRRLAPHPATPD